MNRRLLSLFVFSLVVALLASVILYRLLVSSLGKSQPKSASHIVVVALNDLEVGSLITAANTRLTSCEDCSPAQTFSSVAELTGRGVIATIYKDEPIVAARLAPKGAGAGLAATIPLGKRAVALRVNDVVGLAGFVLPGMRVDVVVSGNVSPSAALAQSNITRTVLQNIEVLSAGQRIERRVDGKPEDVQVVNLLVTPEQAETLTLASNETKVQLVLRNPLDTEEKPTKGTSMDALLLGADYRPAPVTRTVAVAAPRVQPVPKKQKEIATVEVISGISKHEQTFDVQ